MGPIYHINWCRSFSINSIGRGQKWRRAPYDFQNSEWSSDKKNLHNVLSQRGSFHTFDDAIHIGFKDVVLRFSTTSSSIQALNSKSLEVSPSAKRHKIRRVRRPKYILVKIKLRCRGNSVGGCGCFVGTGGSPKDQLSKGMGVDQPIRV